MDLLTTSSPPVLVSLSSNYSSKANNANSRNTFSLLSPISTRTDQEFGMCAVVGVTGTHSIVNLPREVVFKLKSTWFDESIQAEEFAIVNIPIPPGNYSYSTMLAFLNAQLPTFADEPYIDTVYGLGGSGVPTPAPTNIPVSKSEINTKFIFQQYSSILDQSFAGTVNQHVYRTFEIVNDDAVYRLFVMLGLVRIENPDEIAPTKLNFIIRVTPASRVFAAGTTTMTYNIINDIISPFSFDFSGTHSLYLYTESPINSQFRSPFNNNNPSNLLARMPLNVPFGYQFTFQPNNLIYSQQKNMSISNLQVTIRDDFGDFVDFQNLPYMLDLSIKFGQSEDSIQMSGQEGVATNIANAPSVHGSAASYNSGNRDLLFGSSQNNSILTESNKRRKP
jgi:hypothetical protein